MLRFGYGRLYYISNSHNNDINHIGRINSNSSDLCSSSSNENCNKLRRNFTIREGIWIDGELNIYGRTFDLKGNVYVGGYRNGFKYG